MIEHIDGSAVVVQMEEARDEAWERWLAHAATPPEQRKRDHAQVDEELWATYEMSSVVLEGERSRRLQVLHSLYSGAEVAA